MKSSDILPDDYMMQCLSSAGFNNLCPNEGRLLLTELALKANAGYRNSYTEEIFLASFDLLRKDRTLKKYGRQFICSMLYKHSNNKSDFVNYSETYRK